MYLYIIYHVLYYPTLWNKADDYNRSQHYKSVHTTLVFQERLEHKNEMGLIGNQINIKSWHQNNKFGWHREILANSGVHLRAQVSAPDVLIARSSSALYSVAPVIWNSLTVR